MASMAARQSRRAAKDIINTLAIRRWCTSALMSTRSMSSFAIGHKAIPVTGHGVESTKHVIGHTAIPTTTVPKKEGEAGPGVVKVPITEVKGMNEETKKMLQHAGFTSLFPVQASSFEPVLSGRDTIARSKTGTGKTLAFLLPLIQRISENGQHPAGNHCTVLILEPTRELARQVRDEIMKLTRRVSSCVVHGGASFFAQEEQISRGVDFLIATPGRLVDLMQRRVINLSEVKAVILDEADEMLKIGFEKELTEIMEVVPADAQTLLFSATMPEWVKDVAKHRLKKPYSIDSVTSGEKTPETISHVALCTTDKIAGLKFLIRKYAHNERTIVFTRTKLECGELAQQLVGSIAIHGDVSQQQRDQAIRDFKTGIKKILVATDVAARGLDIPNVQLVIQEVPDNLEHYIHRAGRTGRAGKTGVCALLVPPADRKQIRGLAKQIGRPVEAVYMNTTNSMENIAKEAAALGSGETVHKSLVEVAKAFIDTKGPEGVAVLLSKMGLNDGARSLLTGAKNYTTIVLTDCFDYNDLLQQLGPYGRAAAYADFYKDEHGVTCVAVDVPSDDVPGIQKLKHITLSVPEVLSPRVLTHGVERENIAEGKRYNKPLMGNSSRSSDRYASRSGSNDRYGSSSSASSNSSFRSSSTRYSRSNSNSGERFERFPDRVKQRFTSSSYGPNDRFSSHPRARVAKEDDQEW